MLVATCTHNELSVSPWKEGRRKERIGSLFGVDDWQTRRVKGGCWSSSMDKINSVDTRFARQRSRPSGPRKLKREVGMTGSASFASKPCVQVWLRKTNSYDQPSSNQWYILINIMQCSSNRNGLAQDVKVLAVNLSHYSWPMQRTLKEACEFKKEKPSKSLETTEWTSIQAELKAQQALVCLCEFETNELIN